MTWAFQPLLPSAPLLLSAVTGYIRVYDGTTWNLKPVKVWTGAEWVVKPIKFYTGSTWSTSV